MKNIRFTVSFFKNVPRKKIILSLFLMVILTLPALSFAEKLGTLKGTLSINGEKTKNAVVYLLSKDKSLPIETTQNVIIQRNMEFDKTFLAVSVGSNIGFLNKDGITHNIRSRSKSNPFDLGQHFPGTSAEVVLKNPGHVKLECEFHPKMTMSIYVVPTHLAKVSDVQGRYNIPNIPPGKYQLAVWHPSLNEEELKANQQEILIASETLTLTLALKAKTTVKQSLEEQHDWGIIVKDIEDKLNQSLSRWKNKRMTSAATKVMKVMSRLYVASGLRLAIAETLGKERAMAHDQALDKIRKMVQGIAKEGQSETRIRSEIEALIKVLKQDVKQL